MGIDEAFQDPREDSSPPSEAYMDYRIKMTRMKVGLAAFAIIVAGIATIVVGIAFAISSSAG